MNLLFAANQLVDKAADEGGVPHTGELVHHLAVGIRHNQRDRVYLPQCDTHKLLVRVMFARQQRRSSVSAFLHVFHAECVLFYHVERVS